MPQLGGYKFLLDSIVFLYASAADGEHNHKFGGTGFLIGIPSTRWPEKYSHIYVISNWHVAIKEGFSAVRLNRADGRTDTFDSGPENWHFIPGGADIAALPLPPLRADEYRSAVLGPTFFLSRGEMSQLDITAGEDVFMLGRFVDYTGHATNLPAMRFGNISIVDAEIQEAQGKIRKNFVVDVHSRSGYSGSPVFLYRTSGSNLGVGNNVIVGPPLVRLLGIHWSQFPEQWELKLQNKDATNEVAISGNSSYIQGLSGMTCVSPAWDILDVLQLDSLVQQREADEQRLLPKFA